MKFDISDKFKQVNNPVWQRYKRSNGFFQKYFFLKHILMRGKSHPQGIMSMFGEYAFVIMFLGWVGIAPTVRTQIIGAACMFLLLMLMGYLDVYYEVNRKETSFDIRFNPEMQTLFRRGS